MSRGHAPASPCWKQAGKCIPQEGLFGRIIGNIGGHRIRLHLLACLPAQYGHISLSVKISPISPDLEPKILIANRKEEARGEKANGVTVSSLSGFPQPRSFGTSPAAINHANGRTGFASGESLLRKENRPFRLWSQSRGRGFFLHVVVDKLEIFSGARHPSLDVTSNRLSCVCRCKSGCELQKPANV